ncbi:hypothetical protein IDM33_14310 [Acinetobacter seifertii]|nr:hypothetical protein [Acinetobacter seifertii]
MIKSRNAEYTAEYRYDALGRRIQKRSKHHYTGGEHTSFMDGMAIHLLMSRVSKLPSINI